MPLTLGKLRVEVLELCRRARCVVSGHRGGVGVKPPDVDSGDVGGAPGRTSICASAGRQFDKQVIAVAGSTGRVVCLPLSVIARIEHAPCNDCIGIQQMGLTVPIAILGPVGPTCGETNASCARSVANPGACTAHICKPQNARVGQVFDDWNGGPSRCADVWHGISPGWFCVRK